MNSDLGLISALLFQKGFLRCRERGISRDHIDPDFLKIWKFIEDYYDQYRDTPSKQTIEERFGIIVESPKEGLDFWIAELKKRKLHNDLNDLFGNIRTYMTQSDPIGAYEKIKDFVRSEEKGAEIESPISALGSLGDAVLTRYYDAKAGKFGILTPWKKMNAWTGGWYEKDLSFIVARAATGKTFLAIHIASFAKQKGVPTLFITGEMSKEDVAARDFAIEFKIQYQSMRQGKLSFLEEERLKKALQEYKPSIDLDIMDGSQGMRIDDIERAFERTPAKLVVIDAVYRIRARQKTRDRFENMSLVVDDLKQFAQVYNKAVVATTQFNRDAAKRKSPGMEDIALSDVINWNATNVFSMKVSDDKEFMDIYPLKIREGENPGESLRIKWDFVSMCFDEFDFKKQQTPLEDYTESL